jgi:dihydrofolate synthase/folylpolyglutamate synthase
MSFIDFINKKPLFYKEIDYKRMPRVFQKLKDKINLSINFTIHIIGTNGKGSTGRFISSYLHSLGYSTIHYSSPHIFKFNERININNLNITDENLNKYHEKLFNLLGDNDSNILSYFEYTTLLVFIIAHIEKIDFLILEAGLGGEYDATSVINKDLSLITTIGYDHMELLGSSIKEIATTKLNSINNTAIINKYQSKEVLNIADNIAKKRNFTLLSSQDIIDKFNTDLTFKIIDIVNINKLPSFQIENLSLSISALIQIQNMCSINTKDINIDKFINYKMPYRCDQIKENIWIDVGHNSLAAIEIVKYFLNLNKKINLIFNCFSNKDYESTLKIFKPIINNIYYLNINDEKMITYNMLNIICKKLDISLKKFTKIDLDKDYLVFGSFLNVEYFLKTFILRTK